MRFPPNSRPNERGAAVLLFVALVVMAAIAAAGSMLVGRPQYAVQQGINSGFDLTNLRKAVEAQAWAVGGGGSVVCPDTKSPPDGRSVACTNVTPGIVPWLDIAVRERQAKDAWGQYVRLVRSDTQNMSLTSHRGGNEGPCNFILVSGGENGTIDAALDGDIDIRNPAVNSSDDLDIAVCGKLGSASAYDPAPHSLLADGATKFIMTADTSKHIAPRFKAPPHEDWAASDEVMYFGGATDDADTYDLTAGNVGKTACSWHDDPNDPNDAFDFTTQTLRGFIRFQFLPGEAVATQTKNTGQGFALMVIPGERVVTSASCGTAASDNSFGFKGVARPKFALEFDIFRDDYEGAADTSGGRNNPRPEGNHVALLNPLSADYISHGGSGNPQCQVWGTYSNGPALNGTTGACTYPPGDANQYTSGLAEPRPDRHLAIRPAHWLEDSQYTDTVLGQSAAQPYAVRFEFRRLCNADCSVCGVAGNTYIHAKAWIACDGSVETENLISNCPDISTDFQNVEESYVGTTDYMVNSCMPDRSFSFAESFDTVKVGIGFSTLNSAVALLLHRFEAKSD